MRRLDSLCDQFYIVVARVRLRLTARYKAVPALYRVGPARSPAGHFGAATLFGARSVRFESASERHDAQERDAALVQARRAHYVARLWADKEVTWGDGVPSLGW